MARRKTNKVFLTNRGIEGIDEHGNEFVVTVKEMVGARRKSELDSVDSTRRMSLHTDTLECVQKISSTEIIAICYSSKKATFAITACIGCHTAAATGESLSIDIKRVRGGITVSILTAPMVIDSTINAQTAVLGTIAKKNSGLIVGDYLYADITYTPGSTPTPLSDSMVSMVCRY